mgnify:CR=1 FL=1
MKEVIRLINPCNNCTFQGTIDKYQGVKFIKNSEGLTIGCRFTLNVRRNYKNNGEYKYDQILIRYMGIERMPFAKKHIKEGTNITAVGSMTSEEWISNTGKKQMSVLLNMETCNINYEKSNDAGQLPI